MQNFSSCYSSSSSECSSHSLISSTYWMKRNSNSSETASFQPHPFSPRPCKTASISLWNSNSFRLQFSSLKDIHVAFKLRNHDLPKHLRIQVTSPTAKTATFYLTQIYMTKAQNTDQCLHLILEEWKSLRKDKAFTEQRTAEHKAYG